MSKAYYQEIQKWAKRRCAEIFAMAPMPLVTKKALQVKTAEKAVERMIASDPYGDN